MVRNGRVCFNHCDVRQFKAAMKTAPFLSISKVVNDPGYRIYWQQYVLQGKILFATYITQCYMTQLFWWLYSYVYELTMQSHTICDPILENRYKSHISQNQTNTTSI